MTPAAVSSRVTLTIEISGVLFSALQVAAAMDQTTVSDLLASVLRESQITFFADDGESAQLEVLAVRDLDPTPVTPMKRQSAGTLEREILDRLADDGVSDLSTVRRALLRDYKPAVVSREVHRLIKRGELVPMTQSLNGFVPGGGERVRFVARGAH